MKFTSLKNASFKISEISLGCMRIDTDELQFARLIHNAVDLGINFFDTADLYDKGQNEELLGKALHEHRKDLIIATKVGNQWRKDKSGWDWNPTKAYILESVHKSLKRLKTDYIDLYQLHGGTIEDPIDETIEAFEILKQQGYIRAYGISSIRPNVINEYIKRSNISTVMIQYSILDRRPEEDCFEMLEKAGVKVLVRGAVAKGLLVNKQPKDYLIYTSEEIAILRSELENRKRSDRKLLEIAIKYAIHPTAVGSLVLGASNVEQLRENVEVLNQEGLSTDEIEFVQKLSKENKYEAHRLA